MKIGIIGLGLIGGSIAKEMKKLGHQIVGYDQNPTHEVMAKSLNLVDEILPYEDLIQEAELIFLAIPVKYIETILPEVLDKMPWRTIVIDTGSTKSRICESVHYHTKRTRFVASHQMAGTEHSGPKAAVEGLFQGKKNIICQEYMCDEDAINTAMEIFNGLGMNTLFMDPKEHDKHVAYVSHLSHVSAFTLGLTVLDIEKDQRQIYNLASSGFESTVRLAKSSPVTWASIFVNNKKPISEALEAYIGHLSQFKKAIDESDEEKIQSMIEKANDIKRILNGLKLKGIKLS